MTAGADAVMMGNIFSTTKESCGWFNYKPSWWKPTVVAKRYRGQASKQFQIDTYGRTPDCAEGNSGPLIYPQTTVKEVIAEFEGGVKSALSYLGVQSTKDLNLNQVSLIRATQATLVENSSHGF